MAPLSKTKRVRLSKTMLTLTLFLQGAATAFSQPPSEESPRGTQPTANRPEESPSVAFDPTQSTALFVGVRSFTHDEKLIEVPYAVDDAVDLAHLFALDFNVRLVEPNHVVLALSGEPVKPQSQQRLEALLAAGATLHSASKTDIYLLLRQQTQDVGPDGFLIVGMATHGFSHEGIHYLAAADSMLSFRDTAVKAAQLFDAISQSEASRSLVFLDACRERLSKVRAVGPDPATLMSQALSDAIASARGQVVFSAARPGRYAYDDPRRKNGVFTAALIDGLRCDAETDDHGFVTVDTLAAYVNDQVVTWTRKHRLGEPRRGIEVNLGGDAAQLPLASCSRVVAPASQPVTARVIDHYFNVFSESGYRLWGHSVSGRIVRAEVADLNGDGKNEVVVGVDTGGEDTGKILAYGFSGELLWSRDTTEEFNYSGGRSERMTVRSFTVADLFRRGTREVLALSVDAQGWYQSILTIWDANGKKLASYWHPGHLQQIVIGAPTPEHPQRIIVGGLNNDLRPVLKTQHSVGAVFMLDPQKVGGEAPPYFGNSRRGSHLWYGILLPENQSIGSLEILDRNDDGRKDISVWTSTGHVFYIDFEGQVIAKGRGDSAKGDSQFRLLVERRN